MWAFLASKLGLYVIAGVLGAALLGVVWFYVDDYGHQKRLVARQEAQIEELIALDKQKDAAHAMELAQLRADLIFTRRAAERRLTSAEALAADIEEIRTVEVPTDEALCPVHPAIRHALDLVRGAD